MDRFETNTVTNANGDVVLHIGVPGVAVHVVVDTVARDPSDQRPGQLALEERDWHLLDEPG